jgi:hypothetical protein
MTDPAHNLVAFRAARDWATAHGQPQPDDRMLTAYGRVLLAAIDEPRRVEKVGYSVPIARGTCDHCGTPIVYNLAAGICAHTTVIGCTSPYPAIGG